MATKIKCPNCSQELDVQGVLSQEAEQKMKQKYEKELQQSLTLVNAEKKKLEEDQRQFEENRRKENQLFQERLQKEKTRLEAELQLQLRKTIAEDFENQLSVLK